MALLAGLPPGLGSPSNSSWRQYKQNTQKFIYWLTHESNAILKSMPPSNGTASASASLPDPTVPALNTTGTLSVAEIVPMAKFVAAHLAMDVPGAVVRYLKLSIESRIEAYERFMQWEQDRPDDEELRKGNAGHKHFITVLESAFEALAGHSWRSSPPTAPREIDEEEDWLQLSNRFDKLAVGRSEDVEDEGQRKRGRGKRAARSRKETTPTPPVDPLASLPLEAYRIIQDKEGIVTDYLLAIHDLIVELADLRAFVQSMWHRVAYDGLNSAVAGAVSHMAVAAVRERERELFADFPDEGLDTFDTIIQTITRGDINRVQGMFRVELWKVGSDPSQEPTRAESVAIDIEELFLINAYRDLVDFGVDFQQNRTGRPTKRMQKQLSSWNPELDLRSVTAAERLAWRRSFTINWLFDLVNVFGAIVVQRNLRGEKHVYEDVDWSPEGPWDKHRRLFGLNAFAGFATSLAWQKPTTNIRARILPHHVFQLKCIADALAVSRGWSISILKGHVLEPPADNFRPRRDIDLFLDRHNQRMGHGYLMGADIVKPVLDEAHAGQSHRNRDILEAVDGLKYDFINWLGETKYMHGLNGIPPSRFSSTNSNGLWEYSPYLCGTGLAEALTMAAQIGQLLWDSVPEPMLVVHLHNMLVQEGYIKKPIGLFATLQELIPTCFFANGRVPTSDYTGALRARTKADSPLQMRNNFRNRLHAALTMNSNRMVDARHNKFFNHNSTLATFQLAEWMPDRVADADLDPTTILGALRITRTARVFDASGNVRLADTELVRRARERGWDDSSLLGFGAALDVVNRERDSVSMPPALVREGYKTHQRRERDTRPVSTRELLKCAEYDIERDVCGTHPILALNYTTALVSILDLFRRITAKLKEARTETYRRVYQNVPADMRLMALVFAALTGDDEDTLRLMAAEFEALRVGFLTVSYWDDITVPHLRAKTPRTEMGPEQCLIM